jgi:arginyl-tRNA synthetase
MIDELLDDVGTDAARFLFLMRSHDTPLDFDLALAKEESSDNPVYYVQYAHARIASILRQAGDVTAMPDYALLSSPEAEDLLRRLGQLPEEIRDAAARREPHRLTRLAMELAQAFHGFYNRNRVLGVEPSLSAARLGLARATKAALSELLSLLGVSAPERM